MTTTMLNNNLKSETIRLATNKHTARLTEKWVTNPDLAGYTTTSILATLAHPQHPQHDQLMRGLITQTQQHDHDATIILLAALSPSLWRIAHHHHPATPQQSFDDLIVNTTHILNRINPQLNHLYARTIGRARAATPHKQPNPKETLVAQINEQHHPHTHHDTTANQTIAKITIQHLQKLATTGTINPKHWNDLINTKIHNTPQCAIANGRTPQHFRADLSRTTQQLRKHAAQT